MSDLKQNHPLEHQKQHQQDTPKQGPAKSENVKVEKTSPQQSSAPQQK